MYLMTRLISDAVTSCSSSYLNGSNAYMKLRKDSRNGNHLSNIGMN